MTMTRNSGHEGLRQSALNRKVAMTLAATEYRRVADAIGRLGPDDWSRPTSCTGWDVRQLACHVVGMAAMTKSPIETNRQQKKAARRHAHDGGEFIDALTGIQVDERETWSPEQVVKGVQAIGPRAARGRKLTPALVRRRPLPVPQLVNGVEERWSIGYLIDTILTRDPWMHRSDLAVATGVPMELTADHDGVIVADVVSEWAARHGRPYRLVLGGPAGGTFASGEDADPAAIEMDAVEFCRIVSGRGAATGLLTTHVPF